MVKGRETNVENLFQEALREQIGERRYNMWFDGGVRFAFSETQLSVWASDKFICNWLRSAFKHTIEQLCRDFIGRVLPVEFLYVGDDAADAPDFGGGRTETAISADFNETSRRFWSNEARTEGENDRQKTRANDFFAPLEPERNRDVRESDEIAPKKRRGRPPKAKKTTDSARENQEFWATNRSANFDWRREKEAFEQEVDFNARNLNVFAPANAFGGGFDAGNWNESSESQRKAGNGRVAQNSSSESVPRRRRGRPRKNPLPETPEVANANSSSGSNAVAASEAPIQNAFDLSFSNAANVRGGDAVSGENGFAGGAWNLSESERVAWATGEFDESNDFDGFDGLEVGAARPNDAVKTPGKRGRKKSVSSSAASVANAARTVGAGPTLFDVDGGDFSDDEGVSRDERGFNIVKKAASPQKRNRSEAVGANWATLDTFVEGFSNQLAKKVVEVAIVQPATMSPIFIYGPTSVGKTHLLEGVCDRYRRVPGRKPPLLMTAEEFTSAFIQSLRGGGAFRERFRNISLFALDDLHFLEGKTTTQTELLNVVDFLRARRVQMIFAANRPLSELTKLRGELTTRIESGVACKIENPERETLSIIFRRMAFERRLDVPDDVCRYVVSRFATHARQLSGALNRLFAAHLTTGAPINLHLAQEALADMAAANVRSVKLEDVERVVRETFGLDADSLKSKSRSKRCADPRALAMWLARKHTRSALAEIGKFFGGRQHSAVLSAQKKVDVWLKTNEELDAAGTVLSVSDAVERMERSLARPKV